MAAPATVAVNVVATTGDFEKGISSAISSMGTFGKAVSGTMSQITNQLGTVGTAATLGGAAIVTAATAAGVALFELGDKFETAYRTVSNQTGATGKQLEGLTGTLKDLYVAVPTVSLDDLAKSMSTVHQMTGLTGAALEDVTTKMARLAKFTGVDLVQATDSLTKVFNQWGLSAKDQGAALDAFYTLSTKTHVSVTDLASSMQTFGPTLRALGFSFNDSAAMISEWAVQGLNGDRAMQALKKSVVALSEPTQKAFEAFAPWPDLFKQFADVHDPAARFNLVAEAVDRMVAQGKPLGDIVAFLKDVGIVTAKSGADVVEFFTKGAFGADDMKKAIAGSTDSLQKHADSLTNVSAKWEQLKRKIEVALEPVAMFVYSHAFELLSALLDRGPAKAIVPELPPGTKVDPATGMIYQGRPDLIGTFPVHFKNLPTGVKVDPGTGLVYQGTPEQIGKRPQDLKPPPPDPTGLQKFGDIASQVIAPAMKLLAPLFKLVSDNADTLITVLKVLGVILAGVVAVALTSLAISLGVPIAIFVLLAKAVEYVIGAFGDLISAMDIGGFINAIVTGFQQLVGLFADVGSWLVQAGLDLIQGLWNGISENWLTLIVAFFIGMPAFILGYIGDALSWLYQKGVDIIQGLWNGAIALFSSFLGWVGGIGAAVLSWIGDALSWLYQTGWNMIQGLWNGAMAIIGGFLGWVGGIGGAVIGYIGDAASWLWQKGVDAIQGLWNGMISLDQKVIDWVGGIAGRVVNALGDIGGQFINWVKGGWNAAAGWFNDHVAGKIHIPGTDIDIPPKLPTFQKGGTVPGGPNDPMLAILHGGETVIPAGAAGAGTTAGIGGVPPVDMVQGAADDALAVLQTYVDTVTQTVQTSATDVLALQTTNEQQRQTQTDASLAAQNASWIIGMAQIVSTSQTSMDQLNNNTQFQFAVLTNLVQGTMNQVGFTMTVGAASAADAFVGQLQARIPPLTFTMAGYNETILAYGRQFMDTIGAAHSWAAGGIDQAQIAPDGAYRVWAEGGTGGEAYIPKRGANNPYGVLQTAAGWYGFTVLPFQAGGLALQELFFDPAGGVYAIGGHSDHVHAGTTGAPWQAVQNYLTDHGIAAVPTSTTGGSHVANSLHYLGRAVDYGNSVNNVWAVFYALQPLAGGGGGAFSLPNPETPGPPDFGPGILGNGIGSPGEALQMAMMMQFAMQAKLAAERQAVLDRMSQMAGTPGGTPGAKQYAMSRLAAFGWGQDQFGPLDQLWSRESGWNAAARNPTSGAQGIPQALGHGDIGSDYQSQIDWGLNYIAQRYGSPAAAWAHEQSFGWYRKGGLFDAIMSADNGRLSLRPGWNAVYNGLGGSEEMHAGSRVHIEFGDLVVNGNLYGDGEARRAFQTMYDDATREVVMALERQLED